MSSLLKSHYNLTVYLTGRGDLACKNIQFWLKWSNLLVKIFNKRFYMVLAEKRWTEVDKDIANDDVDDTTAIQASWEINDRF